MFLVLGGEPDVNRREQRENERLHHDDDGAQEHERHRHEEGEDGDGDRTEQVIDGHVDHETNRQRDRPDTQVEMTSIGKIEPVPGTIWGRRGA